MKKLLLILLLLSSLSLAQFSVSPIRQQQFPGDVRVFSYAGTSLYCVGYNLSIQSFFASSKDEGSTWNVVTSPFTASDNLRCISFADENTGWLAGDKGVIYKTTNGGTTWTSQTAVSGYQGGTNDIQFFNSSKGYLCGSYSAGSSLFKTTNGGTTWVPVTNPYSDSSSVIFYEMMWDNENSGIITASSGRYLTTTDGGASWTYGKMPDVKGIQYSLTRSDSKTVYSTGSQGQIYKSTDNGQTFKLMASLTTSTLYSIAFLNSNEGFAFGSNGLVYKSADAGANWTLQSPFTTEVLRTAFFLNNKLFVGGYISNIFTTADKGLTWNSAANSGRDFYGIFAENDQNIYIAGGSSSTSRGEFGYTVNGGKYWARPPLVMGNVLYDVVKFGDTIYTCGANGAYFISPDKGSSWINAGIPSTTAKMYKMAFRNANNGFMVSSDGRIFRTTNKGVNWSAVTTVSGVPFYDIKMLSQSRGFAVGGGERIYQTTDGTTFSHGTLAQPAFQLTGLFLKDENKGYICGENGSVYVTSDGFKNILLLTDTQSLQGILVHDVYALNDSSVWAVGQKGTILKVTSPGKMTVVYTVESKDDLTAIARANDSTLVISGLNGSVYKLVDRKAKSVSVKRVSAALNYALEQNYPNPFNPSTKISYSLAGSEMVDLRVYDMLGREVSLLVNEYQSAGFHTVNFNASGLPSGFYVYRIKAGTYTETRKMLMLK